MNNQRFKMTFTAEQDGVLLREALSKWGISKRALTAIKFDGGFLAVNGEERNVRYVLQKGDQIDVYFPLEEVSDGLLVEHGTLNIVFEDEAILILDKPPYQSTIPSREHPVGSIANFICGYFEKQAIHSTVHIVTRLDRDTSGLLCIAKHRHVHHLLSQAQKNRQISREYEAIVHGCIQEDEVSIIAPIGRKDTSIIEREVRADGQFAHTDMRVINRYIVNGEQRTHVRLKLHTGRTHQIRVHMAYIGHPLLGDELYGGSRETIGRQALHCVALTLNHPLTGEQLLFESKLPEDMQKILR